MALGRHGPQRKHQPGFVKAATLQWLLDSNHYRGNDIGMPAEDHKIAESRLTAQGQISVPAEVRRRLGVGPGSVIEWDADGERIVVRRAGRYTSSEVHEEVFPYGAPAPKSADELKAGIRGHVKKRHARR
jgi:AbrB family looped-hinge helix DNA binding protein